MRGTVPALLVLVALCAASSFVAAWESRTSAVQAVDSPHLPATTSAGRTTRPKLTLQAALTQADSYLLENRIDTSHYYLLQVRFILYGEGESKTPRWHVWWVHEDGSLGKAIELLVDMDGNITRLGSM